MTSGKVSARPSETGSRKPSPSSTGLGPPGFDPARLASLSFVLSFNDGGERLSVVQDSRRKLWSDKVVIRQYGSDDNAIYVDLADLNWLIGALKLVEIATRETASDPKNDTAAIAQNPPETSDG